MTKRSKLLAGAFLALVGSCASAHAPTCANGPGGFEGWKREFAAEAQAKGVGANAIQALMGTTYAQATINADRGLRSFKLSLEEFMRKCASAAIVAQGRGMKQKNAALFASIEQRYGVPAGPLIAIWGMESAFGT